MSTVKHTPGPWVYTKQVGIAHGISAAKDAGSNAAWASVAKVWSAGNVSLIAAAPELLEVLTHAENVLADYIQTIERTGASLNYGHSVLAAARAVISKATGAP